MQKVITFLLAAVLLLSGCGGSGKAPEPTEAPTSAPTAEPTKAPEPTAAPEPAVEVDDGLFSVTITIPAEYMSETTQEELDAACKEHGYKSATLNEDGSATYVMTKDQHRELLSQIENTIRQGLDALCGSNEYPGIEAIEAGEAFREFTVRLNTADAGLQETFSAVLLYAYGLMYNAYLEDGADNVHVKFVNNAGETVLEADSRDMAF